MLAVLAKEFRNYFLTPVGYIFMGFFLTISGVLFTASNLVPASSNYYPVLSNLIFIFLIAVPILTMRLISIWILYSRFNRPSTGSTIIYLGVF